MKTTVYDELNKNGFSHLYNEVEPSCVQQKQQISDKRVVILLDNYRKGDQYQTDIDTDDHHDNNVLQQDVV